MNTKTFFIGFITGAVVTGFVAVATATRRNKVERAAAAVADEVNDAVDEVVAADGTASDPAATVKKAFDEHPPVEE